MFDIGFGIGEIIFIGGMALIILGPKEFPVMMVKCGQFIRNIKNIGNDFKQDIDSFVHEGDMLEKRRELAKKIESFKSNDES